MDLVTLAVIRTPTLQAWRNAVYEAERMRADRKTSNANVCHWPSQKADASINGRAKSKQTCEVTERRCTHCDFKILPPYTYMRAVGAITPPEPINTQACTILKFDFIALSFSVLRFANPF
jgi:hypothetical protein